MLNSATAPPNMVDDDPHEMYLKYSSIKSPHVPNGYGEHMSPLDLDLSQEGMQLLDKMNNDEQTTFLEFHRRLQESNRASSTASSFINASESVGPTASTHKHYHHLPSAGGRNEIR